MSRLPLIPMVVVICALASPPVAPAAAAGGLSVVSPTNIEVHLEKEGKPATITLTVRNDARTKTKRLGFKFVGDAKMGVIAPQQVRIAADDVARFQLKIVPEAGTKQAAGQLVVRAGGEPAATVPLTLSPAGKVPSWVSYVIWGPLLGALIFVFFAYVMTGDKGEWSDKIGPVNWDFSKSWASNVTIFSALLGTILSAGVLPEHTSSARVATYAGLNLLFGLGVLVGPFLYTALQKRLDVNRERKDTEPQYQGTVGAFLIAATLTLWVTAGEFATIWELFGELRSGGSLPDVGLFAFRALIVLAGIALVVLTWTRTRGVLRRQGEAGKAARTKVVYERLKAAGVEGLPEDEVKPELEPWPVF